MASRLTATRNAATRPSLARPASSRRLGRKALGPVFALFFSLGWAANGQEPERPLEPGAEAARGEAAPRGEPAPSDAASRNERAPFEPASLVVWNREITVFRMPYGSATPAERAGRARRSIESLPLDQLLNDIELEEADVSGLHGLLVSVGGRVLFGIAEDDLDPLSGETLASVGEAARQGLREVFDARLDQHRPRTLARGFGIAVAATLVLGVIFFGDTRLRHRIERGLERRERAVTKRIGGLDVRPLLTSTRRSLIAFLIWAWRFLLCYAALTVVLAQFPYTRPWADRLGDFLYGIARGLGRNVVAALPDLLVAILILAIAMMISRAIDGVLQSAEGGEFEVSWLRPATVPATRRIVKIVIWLFALSFAYPYLPGADSTAFQGLSVLAGAALSLGATGVVSQLMSGIVLTYSRALKAGDLVQIGDTTGFVIEIGILSTKLRTPRRELVTLPNTVVLTQRVTNYFEEGALLAVPVTIGYDAPWRQVHALLLSAVARTPGLRAEPKPYVVQRGLSQFYVEYEVRAELERPEERYPTMSALNAQIQDAFNEAGVQIMTPEFESQPQERIVVPREAWEGRPTAPRDP